MRSRKSWIAAAAVAVVALVATLLILTREDGTTEFAGMEMSAAQLDDMTQESMGVSSLARVKKVAPEDRIASLPHRMEDGVKVFDLQARPVRWEYREGQSVAAWGYEQQVPGPAIRVTEGDRVRVEFTNRLPEPTTVHWHGVNVPFDQDGVPGITQAPIAPGDKYVYEFTATPAGTRMYHTHGSTMRDEARQLDMGLSGALIIEPRHQANPPAVDQTLVLDEWAVEEGGRNAAMVSGAGHAVHTAGFNVFTINGRAAPDFEPIMVKQGQTVRLRMINVGSSATHPMHLHGHQFTVTALDGNSVPLSARQLRNVITLAPGETADVEFVADNPGVWMLHCHELHHADAGMMTLLQYEGFKPTGEAGEGNEHTMSH